MKRKKQEFISIIQIGDIEIPIKHIKSTPKLIKRQYVNFDNGVYIDIYNNGFQFVTNILHSADMVQEFIQGIKINEVPLNDILLLMNTLNKHEIITDKGVRIEETTLSYIDTKHLEVEEMYSIKVLQTYMESEYNYGE